MLTCDYIVVGSGLTGATIARVLADAGREVVVLERRDESGGNVVDDVHQPSGIRFSKFGPHYFRTSSERVWSFATRFSPFFPFEARVKTLIDGRLEYWPPQREFIRRIAGDDWTPAFTGKPANFEEAALSMMPRQIYDRCVKNYSEKMWGRPACTLAADLCKRFDVRDGDDRLTPHARFQGLPVGGYSLWVQRMLEGIPVRLGVDYLRHREDYHARKLLVFTGPIDEYFGFDLGRLAYRGQMRSHYHLPKANLYLSCGQVNYPSCNELQIRAIEWKHMLPKDERDRAIGTLITTEIPFTPTDMDSCEYPFPSEDARRLYQQYRARADTMEGVLIEGRMGRFVYIDQDQAIGRGLMIADRILGRKERVA